MRQEQRTISGRPRGVTVVDTIAYLDPNVRSGWEGYLCVELTASDRSGATATLALRGAAVRAPRTAVYDVVVRAGSELPAGWQLDVNWASAAGAVWCGPAHLTTGAGEGGEAAAGEGDGDATAESSTTVPSTAVAGGVPPLLSAGCTTMARLHPDGIVVAIAPVSPDGSPGQPWTVQVPVNGAYCTPDDPFGAAADGCSTGFQQTWLLDLGDSTEARITVTALRTAGPGQMATNPSHAWRIDPPQAFAA